MSSGGGSTQTPLSVPQPPSFMSQVKQYEKAYPRLFNLEQQYAPQQAQLDFNLYNQFAPQYNRTQRSIEQELYPETSGLQENLAKQAREGMTQPLPDWARQQYMSDFNAGLGTNVNAPIGVSDRSFGLMNLQKQWGDYYRDLALNLAGRQPLQQAANPTFRNPNEGFGNALNYGANTYGNYAQSYVNQPVVGQRKSSPWGPLLGAGLGAGLGSLGGQPLLGAQIGAGAGGMF